MEDDDEGSYSSSSFRLENQHGLTAPPPLLAPVKIHNSRSKGNKHATTMSNEHVTVDIPHSFVLSDEDNDEDDNDEDDNDEANGREGGRQKRRRKMRQSNALNEDRYDFCLVIDTSKTSEDGCENGTATAAVTTTSSTSTWCTCFSSKKKTTTKAKEEDNNEVTTEQDEYKRNEESRVSGESGESDNGDDDNETENDDPARKYNRRPMEKLRRLRRVARREIELQGEDDDDDDDDDDENDQKKQRGRLFTTSSAMETLDVEHTGAGLQGQRMTSLIRAKLRHSGLQVKRVQNLTGTRTLLKVRAKQERLEEEAERMRLVMRTKDGGYARFKMLDRQIFCGAGYASMSKNHVRCFYKFIISSLSINFNYLILFYYILTFIENYIIFHSYL